MSDRPAPSPGADSVYGTPPMPEVFTDRAAWDAIHHRWSPKGTSLIDLAVIGWQKDNQERCRAAAEAARAEADRG